MPLDGYVVVAVHPELVPELLLGTVCAYRGKLVERLLAVAENVAPGDALNAPNARRDAAELHIDQDVHPQERHHDKYARPCYRTYDDDHCNYEQEQHQEEEHESGQHHVCGLAVFNQPVNNTPLRGRVKESQLCPDDRVQRTPEQRSGRADREQKEPDRLRDEEQVHPDDARDHHPEVLKTVLRRLLVLRIVLVIALNGGQILVARPELLLNSTLYGASGLVSYLLGGPPIPVRRPVRD